jgi:hypothetical protein
MKAKDFIEEHKKGRRAVKHNPKPRSPVAHAAQSVIGGSASGAHKDKTKEIPRHQKHKTADVVGESYQERLTRRLDELSIDTLKSYKEKSKAWSDKEKENDPNPERGSEAWMKRVYRSQGRSTAQRKINQKEKGVTVGEAGYQQGFADPKSPDLGAQDRREFKRAELQHELGHERNNIAVSINGKLWKVFAGKGTADSFEERQYLNHMRNWAEKKSAASGKKWSVGLTGADATT